MRGTLNEPGPGGGAKFVCAVGSHVVIIYCSFGESGLRVRFINGVRVTQSGMIKVRVDVWVSVKISNLLGSD